MEEARLARQKQEMLERLKAEENAEEKAQEEQQRNYPYRFHNFFTPFLKIINLKVLRQYLKKKLQVKKRNVIKVSKNIMANSTKSTAKVKEARTKNMP